MLKSPATLTALLALTSGTASSQALFGTQYTVFDEARPGDLALLDIDQDGDLDLAVCTSPWDMYTVENLGNGQFGAPTVLERINVFQDPRGIEIADLDGDGLDDIACAANSSARVSWWRSNGDGTFSIERRFGTLNRPLDVATGDVDLDGDIDVVVSSTTVNTFRFFENEGGGTFSTGADPPGINGSVYGIALGLIDGDSFPDLISCTNRSPGVYWSRGNGDGTFEMPQPVSGATGDASQPVIADLNGDGWNDVVATFFTAQSV
ncbi:MAG: VCBS repeat-containing protein, partial [Planctomycetota bacterium]